MEPLKRTDVPRRLGDTEEFRKLEERVRKAMDLLGERRRWGNEREAACAPGHESCNLDGKIRGKGFSVVCSRLEQDMTGCVVGQARYRLAVQRFLASQGYGDLPGCCFEDPAFVWDPVTELYRDYARRKGHEIGINMLVCGGTGIGKTFGLLALLGDLSARYHVEGLVFPALLLLGRGIWDDDLARAVKTPVLLLDDLGLEPNTSSVHALLTTLLERRVAAGRSTLLTTNLVGGASREEAVGVIYDRYGDRITDRLASFECHFFNLESRR